MMPLKIAYNTTWINNSIPKIIKIIGLFFDIKFIDGLVKTKVIKKETK